MERVQQRSDFSRSMLLCCQNFDLCRQLKLYKKGHTYTVLKTTLDNALWFNFQGAVRAVTQATQCRLVVIALTQKLARFLLTVPPRIWLLNKHNKNEQLLFLPRLCHLYFEPEKIFIKLPSGSVFVSNWLSQDAVDFLKWETMTYFVDCFLNFIVNEPSSDTLFEKHQR